MNLYLIYQNENNDYDTYDSVVVCAESEEEARDIHPNQYSRERKEWSTDDWCLKENVKARYLGVADISLEKGVVCASFNAG